MWGSLISLKLYAFPTLPNPFPSLTGFSIIGIQKESHFSLSLNIWEQINFLYPRLPYVHPSPPRHPLPHQYLEPKHEGQVPFRVVSRNIITTKQMSPEKWSQRNQTSFNRYQGGIPLSLLWHFLWELGLEILGQLCLLFPPQDIPAQRGSSPEVLMSMLLAQWYETR